MKQIFVIIILFAHVLCFSQNNTAHIHGIVIDNNNNPLEFASITIEKHPHLGVLSKKNGYYSIHVPAPDTITIIVTSLGYKEITKKLYVAEHQSIEYNVVLEIEAQQIPDVRVVYNIEQEENITYLSTHKLIGIAGVSLSGIEGNIKTFPGVSSKSELSSQYSVRGGSYDENLVFINGIPTFKPTMASSDKQEGLSVINPYMVSSLEFSSGGFGVEYGDKLSSVLSVFYKDVEKSKIQFDGSLMDANLCIEGLSKDSKFSYIIGTRYKNTSLVLNSLQEDGEYEPVFYDVQSLFRYSINPKTQISYWLYAANNTFKFYPSTRITDFGHKQTYRMKVYFDGNEKYQYQNIGNAISIKRSPNQYKTHTTSMVFYQGFEHENFDVHSRYRLDEIQAGQDRDAPDPDSVKALAIGSYLEHGRNYLQTNTFQIVHDGKQIFQPITISWGGQVEHSLFDAKFNEWTYRDSANYALPYSDTLITLESVKNRDVLHQRNLVAAYINANKRITWGITRHNTLRISLGIRTTFDDYTMKFLHNPRMRILIKPESKKNIGVSLSAGVYYQPPHFKEIINQKGEKISNVQAQKSIHYVVGYTSNETLWGRPFRFNSDVYFKHLTQSIPYIIDNVTTIYYPELEAEGYIVGIDSKLNGEFVKGVESWISVSLMQAREHLKNDDTWIRKPNDQLFSFSMFFQDYVPGSEHVKMNMTCIFGSRLPLSAPNSEYKDFDAFTLSTYSRIDIGFLMILFDKSKKTSPSKHQFEKIWVGAEIFNLMNVGNKISYFWIKDVNNGLYAVPNFLTSRRFNVKLSISI